MTDTFRSLIDRRASDMPDHIYLVDADCDRMMSYRDLKETCVGFGNLLHSMNVRPSSKVAFLMDNGYWTVSVLMGTMYNGCTSVPINAVASRKNIIYALQHSDTDLIFVSSEYKALICEIASEVGLQERIVDVDMDVGLSVQLSQFDVTEPRFADVDCDSSAMILHTSGTTSLPKGAVLTHTNLIAGGRNVMLAQDLTETDIAYCMLPLYHINGQVVTTVAPLVSQSQVVMSRKFSLSKFWPIILKYRCTWFSTVPTITKYLLDDARNRGDEKKNCSLRFARSASSAMPAQMHADFEETFAIPMLESIGLTETAAPILANPMPPAIRKSGSVGIPFGNEVAVIDNEENVLGINEVGEIIVRGDNVIGEYYKAPEATAEAFTSKGWFRTGDLGYYDEDGYFYVTGRIKELIIKGGENVSPREIDDVLYRNKNILEVASFGYPSDAYGQVIAVAVVLKPNSQCTEKDLLDFCVKELGEFLCPSKIFFVDELPKGPSGKIQRLRVANSLIENN